MIIYNCNSRLPNIKSPPNNSGFVLDLFAFRPRRIHVGTGTGISILFFEKTRAKPLITAPSPSGLSISSFFMEAEFHGAATVVSHILAVLIIVL